MDNGDFFIRASYWEDFANKVENAIPHDSPKSLEEFAIRMSAHCRARAAELNAVAVELRER